MPAAPPLAHLPARLDPRVLALARGLVPVALRRGCGIRELEVVGAVSSVACA
jgi:hypothetical protein